MMNDPLWRIDKFAHAELLLHKAALKMYDRESPKTKHTQRNIQSEQRYIDSIVADRPELFV